VTLHSIEIQRPLTTTGISWERAGSPDAYGTVSVTAHHHPRQRSRSTISERWTILIIIAASLLAALGIDLLVLETYVVSSLYAVPILIAADRFSPRLVLGVATLAITLNIIDALVEGTPIVGASIGIIGLLIVGYLAILLSAQRGQTVRHLEEIAAAHRRLQRSELEFRTLAENAPAIIARFDPERHYLYVNPAVEQATGIPAHTFIGKTSAELKMSAEFATSIDDLLRQVLTTRREASMEFAVPGPNGPVYYQAQLVPEFASDDSVVSALLIAQDITQRKQAEEERRFLTEASNVLATSLDFETTLRTVSKLAVPHLADWCSIHAINSDGSIRQVAVAYGNPVKETLAMDPEDDHPLDLSRPMAVVKVIETGKPEIISDISVMEFIAGDAEERKVMQVPTPRSAMVVPLLARRRALGVITLISAESGRRYDASDLSLAEDLGRRAALAVDNAWLYHEAQEAIHLREEFLSIASHELKTPLTTIKAYTQLLARRLHPPDIDTARLTDLTGQLQDQVNRLETLVADLLDASRSQQGRLEIHPEEIDLVGLARQVLDRFEHAPERTVKHRLGLDAPDDVEGVWDRDRLDQVLTNLISNALKYSPEGGDVIVRIRRIDQSVELAVSDQGVGIPVDEQSRLFQPFMRGGSVHSRVSGTGLGLYITSQIVERHGGTIGVKSAPGVGTTFTVRLPLKQAAASESL
jgi:PAS domain S-box-containing protein